MKKNKVGVILVNLGTPESPTPKAISRYLWQFLTDWRVVDLPKWKWWPLLKLIILPHRSKKVAKTYQSVWTPQGSPLLAISKEQQKFLQQYLDQAGVNARVEIAMTYGAPSFAQALENLAHQNIEKLIVFPLFPQYSSTTTAAVFDAFANSLKKQRGILPFEFIHSYYQDENYIQALVSSIQERLQADEFLLFSFHGIPLRYEQNGDNYRYQCEATAHKVAERLGLGRDQWQLTYQSQFGKEEWLSPYTDAFLEELAGMGKKKVAVVCPGFSADCLETLEEIDEENRDIFLSQGGESFQYIPALNVKQEHIHCLGEIVLKKIKNNS